MDLSSYPLKGAVLLILGGFSLPISMIYSMYKVNVSTIFGGSSIVIPLSILLIYLLVTSLGVTVMISPDQSSLVGYSSIAVGLSVIPVTTTLSYIGLTTGDFPIFPQDTISFVIVILEKVVTVPLVVSVVLITVGGILCVLWGGSMTPRRVRRILG